jgi:diketogulonate reductase-like aldo/keto reductase
MGVSITVQADDEFNTKGFIDFCNTHGIQYFFWKPYENPKNQLIERANLTIKRFMLKYIDKYGWPSSGDLADDVQQVLDACTWYYNHL